MEVKYFTSMHLRLTSLCHRILNLIRSKNDERLAVRFSLDGICRGFFPFGI
jgi:hypothetical protein